MHKSFMLIKVLNNAQLHNILNRFIHIYESMSPQSNYWRVLTDGEHVYFYNID